jgi:hypothetical protein
MFSDWITLQGLNVAQHGTNICKVNRTNVCTMYIILDSFRLRISYQGGQSDYHFPNKEAVLAAAKLIEEGDIPCTQPLPKQRTTRSVRQGKETSIG